MHHLIVHLFANWDFRVWRVIITISPLPQPRSVRKGDLCFSLSYRVRPLDCQSVGQLTAGSSLCVQVSVVYVFAATTRLRLAV